MRSHGVTHWILSQREYHEDVAWRSVADPTRINARRRTVMIYTLDHIENVISERSFVSFKATVWEVSELQWWGVHIICVNASRKPNQSLCW